MTILLVGGSGQLGREIVALGPPGAGLVAPSSRDLDVTAPGVIERVVAERPWSVVINAAAYTAVDRAEQDRERAHAINALAPGRLAAATGARGIPLVHVSTDYVFDGTKGSPYAPSDPVAPLGVYGATKEAGERAVRSGNPRHVILRTAWVHGPSGANFVATMLRLAGEREEIRVVDDQRGTPTAAASLAAACLVVARRLVGDDARAPVGTHHFTDAGETTWCGFARTIFELAGPRLPRRPRVVAITTADYPTPARRPADSRLDCTTTVSAFGLERPHWRDALASTLDRLLTREPHVS